MPKLRKTLPKNFKETVASGDVAALKAALKKCEPDAHCSAFDDRTALMNPDLPEEVIHWLVEEYGADVNYAGRYGNTALSEAAVRKPGHIELLVSLGADVNFQIGNSPTALMYAAMFFRTNSVKELLRLGADVHMTGGYLQNNALEEALSHCENANIPQMAEIAQILIDAGVGITDNMKKQVTGIGNSFEFYRDSFDPDYLPVCDAALTELYTIFDVPPVPKKQKYDGSAPISVHGRTWTKQYNELWELLVPGSGKAKFVQGEAIRIVGRLSHEILDNGGANWDDDFRAMRDTLAGILSGGKPVEGKIIQQIKKISPNTDEGAFEGIAKAVVKWILANPRPVELGEVSYRR